MSPYPLERSDTSTKIMITLFMLFMIGSFTIALLNVYDKVGRAPSGVAERYGPEPARLHAGPGDSSTGAPAVTTDTGGIYNESASASDEHSGDSAPAAVRMNTYSALLDVTHPHIFEMPIVILVLCHFLMRTKLAEWAKIATYALSFGGVAGLLATPWLVRYVSITFAPIMLISAVALAISAVPLILVPLLDMWVPSNRRQTTETNGGSVAEDLVTD